MSDPVTVRPATDRDSDAIRAVVTEVSAEFGLASADSYDEDLTRVASWYKDAGGWFEVLELDGQIVGTIGMIPVSDSEIELRKMYFTPALRGRGLGKALLGRNLRLAAEAGFKTVTLETATVLEAAIGLYKRYGFSRVEEPGRCSTGCDQAWQLQLDQFQAPALDREVSGET